MFSLPACLLLFAAAAADPARPVINPFPAPARHEPLAQWTFDRDAEGWTAEHHCVLKAEDGTLRIRSSGEDPYFHRPVDFPGGGFVLKIRACNDNGSAAIYWTTDRSPRRGGDKAVSFSVRSDNQWHEYSVSFHADGRLTDLRIDPGTMAGRFDIDWIRLDREIPYPLEVDRVEFQAQQVRFHLQNRTPGPIVAKVLGTSRTFPGAAVTAVDVPLEGKTPLEGARLEYELAGMPVVARTVYVCHPDAAVKWLELQGKTFLLKVAPDGSAAVVVRHGRPAAVIAPLVLSEGRVPSMKGSRSPSGLQFEGDGVRLDLAAAGNEISVAIRGKACEGPVVRALGAMKQGLFAGLEYLSAGEYSSSMLDIETPEHVRYAPDPLKVTMPLMSFLTERGSVAMTWKDMRLQPVFATPNFFDGAPDHRMSLRGDRIDAAIQIDDLPIEETIFWAAQRQGLPPLPPAPRSIHAQWDLCLKAINGPLKTEAGWGHCVEDHWARQPFADVASTIFRLTGEIPQLPRLALHGAHVHNETVFFLTGRAGQWLEQRRQQVRGLIAQQRPDGSYRYDGPFRRGHFENTANGICARPAQTLLEYAWITGDREALGAGLRTLDYMRRFDVPRGAQVWEVPLHTPDQLASAYCVWAYVLGYQMTNNQEYLREARRWALSGIPFVYMWSRYPVMLYGTPPVLGATNWKAPNWIGLPVQWVGGVYAYALTKLAPYDKSLDWNHLARGILISAEQQQYPDGQYVGLLPDSFHLETQERRPWRINPCALVSLRLVLDGQLDFLSVAAEGERRVAVPFPVAFRNGKMEIQAPRGVRFQYLENGRVMEGQTVQK